MRVYWGVYGGEGLSPKQKIDYGTVEVREKLVSDLLFQVKT